MRSGFFNLTTMIIYNVTVKVDVNVHADWLRWMRKQHIPDVIATKCFTSCRISRLLSQNEIDGITYSIQYLAPSMKTFHKYQAHYAPKLQKEHLERYGERAVAFRTMMELVEEFIAEV